MILHGDSLIVLKDIPDNSVDSIVTDPPYGLNFMGKKWDYDVPSKEIWVEALRVLKPGGHLLSFGGTRTYHRLVVAIEDAGFEIRDQIQWIYGSGFPKSHNLKDEWQGWGTALKPANEPICVARKPLEKGLTVAQNVLKWGCGALNIDASRIEAADQDALDAAVKRMTGNSAVGWKNTSSNGIQPISAQGRWPANVLFDEHAAEMLDEQSGTLKSGKPGTRVKEWTGYATGLKTLEKESGFGDSGGASRFFYCAKASKSERNAGLEGMLEKDAPKLSGGTFNSFQVDGGISTITNTERKSANHHPTVKPIKLMEYLIKLVTPPKGLVLDPFCGSGSTGVAARNLGFEFIGIEMNEEYCEIAEKRTGTK